MVVLVSSWVQCIVVMLVVMGRLEGLPGASLMLRLDVLTDVLLATLD